MGETAGEHVADEAAILAQGEIVLQGADRVQWLAWICGVRFLQPEVDGKQADDTVSRQAPENGLLLFMPLPEIQELLQG